MPGALAPPRPVLRLLVPVRSACFYPPPALAPPASSSNRRRPLLTAFVGLSDVVPGALQGLHFSELEAALLLRDAEAEELRERLAAAGALFYSLRTRTIVRGADAEAPRERLAAAGEPAPHDSFHTAAAPSHAC